MKKPDLDHPILPVAANHSQTSPAKLIKRKARDSASETEETTQAEATAPVAAEEAPIHLAQNEAGVTSSDAPLQPAAETGAAGAGAGAGAGSDDDGNWGLIAGLLGGGLGVAAAAGGGGSAGGGTTAAAISTLTGTIVGGPVLGANDLKVVAYRADGVTVLGEGTVDAAGRFTISVGDYTGVVIAKVLNQGANPDYLDEATNAPKDLNAQLFATGVVTAPNSTLTLNINALTTVAHQKAVEAVGVGQPLDSTTVGNTNTALAQAFGLSDLHATQVVTVNGVTTYNALDGLTAGELYGTILASLSGADQSNGGNSQTTINNLVANINVAGATATLNATAQTEVISGARTSSVDTNFQVTTLIDTIAPTANFTGATDNVGSVTGALTSGQTTDDTTLVLAGSCEANSTVNVYNGTTLLGAATVIGTNWSYTATVANGTTYQFNAKETDVAGNTSVATANFTVIGDTAAPTANLASTTDNVGSVTGALTSGQTTDDPVLVLAGTCEANSTVNVYDGATLLGAATVIGTNWSYTATVANGTTYQFNVKETDVAGNTSAATGNFTVIGDTAAPTANLASATDNVGSVTGALTSGNTTDDTALVLAGSCEAGSTVNVYDGATLLGAATVTGTNWSYTATVANGTTYQFNVKETDAAGNTSAATANFTVIGDTAAPTVSSVAITSATGIQNSTLTAGDVVSVAVTMSETTTVSGTPQLALNIGGTTVQAGYISGSGSSQLVFSYTILAGQNDTDGISIGTNALTLNGGTLRDAAGNDATLTHAAVNANPSFKVDTAAPTLDLTAGSDSGSSSTDNITNVTTPIFDVTGAAGTTLTLFNDANNNNLLDGGDTTLGTLVLTGVTSGTITASPALTAGRYTYIKVKDSSGLVSAAHPAITVDTAVSAPTLDLTSASDTKIGTDNITYLTTPTFAVTGESGATITLFDDVNGNGALDAGDTTLGTTTLVGTTNGTITSSALVASAIGTDYANIRVKQTDAAGNVSAASAAHATITIKSGVTVPTLDLQAGSDTGTSNTDNITNKGATTGTELIFDVTGAAGTTLTLFNDVNNDGVVAFTDSNGNGVFDYGIDQSSEALGVKILAAGMASGTITASTLAAGTYDRLKVISSESVEAVSGTHAPIVISTAAPTVTNTVTDDFNDANWDNWVQSTVTAAVGDGQETMTGSELQLTTATNSQSGGALYNVAFSSSQDMTFEFRYYSGGGVTAPADGISFFLVDGANTAFNLGVMGDKLGYADGGTPANGLDGGWLGVGLYEYTGGGGAFTRDSFGNQAANTPGIGVLGSESATTPYGYITSKLESIMGGNSVDGGYRRVKISLGSSATNTLQVQWDCNDDGAYDYTPVNVDLDSFSSQVAARPDTLKFGFAAGTGGFNNRHAIDSVTVTTGSAVASITSAFGAQYNTLDAGDVVNVTVSLSAPAIVTGTPQLALNIGGTTVQANYSSGSGTNALVFSYTIQAGQYDANGISIDANSLTRNGGTIKSASGVDVAITHVLVADNASYKVEAPTASVTAAAIANNGNAVVQSTETGTAYLVKNTLTVSSLADITAAADAQWNSVTISIANTNTNLSVAGLQAGVYKVYTVDAAGYLSAAADNTVVVTNTATAVIDLTDAAVAGDEGQLIAPVYVDGNWYSYWDRSGDGTNADAGALNGGFDYTTHDVLDGIFTQDINGITGGGGNTNDTYRYATLNGVKLALPTHGEGAVTTGLRSGTAIDNTPSGEANPTYNDLLAIWDGYNGTTTGTNLNGVPTNWQSVGNYWSATSSTNGHASVLLSTGGVTDIADTTNNYYVALQVL